jgi:hypothetical protein
MSPEYLDTPIMFGKVFLGDKALSPNRKEGEILEYSGTNNTRFSTAIVKGGLRFDESLNFTGGEDIRFYKEAFNLGYEARYTERAILNESPHPAMTCPLARYQHLS